MKAVVVTLVLALGLAACGGDGAPTPTPLPTLSGVAISSSTDLLKIGQSETLTLTGTMSDGRTSPVTGTWRSDNPAVATVDANGRVTGVGSGETAISAESSGVRATPRTIRVLPDYHGRWSGDWRVAACTADGDWGRTDICREVPVGMLADFGLSLTQDRDNATGNVTLDDVAGPVQGPIRPAGHLNLAGAFTEVDEGLVIDVSLSDWETTTTDNQRMTGRFTLGFRAAGLQGSVRFTGELRVVGKTGSAPVSGGARELRLHRAIVAAARR